MKLKTHYGFIGNMKKPYTIITWLASKSIAYLGDGEDSTAGFYFMKPWMDLILNLLII